MSHLNLVGHRFGELTVIRFDRDQKCQSGAVLHYWACQCPNGHKHSCTSANLRSGASQQCKDCHPSKPISKGKMFGSLTATGRNKPTAGRKEPAAAEFVCLCGKTVWKEHGKVRKKFKPTRCCGRRCPYNPRVKPPVKGDRFGFLVATGKWEMRRKGDLSHGAVFVEAICDCGNIRWIAFSNIRSGNTKTCGTGCIYDPRQIGILADQRAVYRVYAAGCHSGNRRFIPLSFEAWLKVAILPCAYCGQAPRLQGAKKRMVFSASGIDHFDPKVLHPYGNSVPCCLPCNHEKHDMTPAQWEARLELTRGKSKAGRIVRRVRHYLKEQQRLNVVLSQR